MAGHSGIVGRTAVAVATLACSLIAGSDLRAQAPARDSLGGRIVETDGQQARAVSQITVRGQPELQIGLVDGDPSYLFSDISAVALLPGEGILVVDRSAELRFYDFGGRLIDRRGRLGDGPGELRTPRFLNSTVGDSLLIFDTSTRRFTVYASEGEGFRTFSGAGLGVGEPLAASGASGVRLVWSVGGVIPPPSTERPVVRNRTVRLVDLERETDDTIMRVPYSIVMERTPGRPLPTFVLAPFTFPVAVAGDGDRFLITTPSGPSVLEYSWTGDLQRIFRLLEPTKQVTDADLRSAIERRTESNPAVRPSYEGLEPPQTEPTFQSLLVDDDGWLWAQTYQLSADAAAAWILFDSEGRGRGSVVMPEGFSVSTIGRGYVAGVWRDELDVEYVRLYRVEGRP